MQYRQWAPRLRDLGECEVKHGVRLHLVNLYAEPLGNAALPQKFQQATLKPAAEKPARRWMDRGARSHRDTRGCSGILFHDTLLTLSAKTFTGLRKQQLS